MSITIAIFTYLVTWFITPFMVLPFRMSWRRTLLWNTLLAAVITFIIYLLVKSGLVPLRDVY